jgi:hypothetical protein
MFSFRVGLSLQDSSRSAVDADVESGRNRFALEAIGSRRGPLESGQDAGGIAARLDLRRRLRKSFAPECEAAVHPMPVLNGRPLISDKYKSVVSHSRF